MADSEVKPAGSRRNTSGTASRRSAGSRPPSPPGLARLVSGTHLDDHSQYHGHNYHGNPYEDAVEDDSSDDTELTEKETNTTELEQGSSEEIVPEVRNGIEDQRDVEAGPKLEKSKSSRSARDPNIVAWDGPDDPDNPKNWTMKHKWAATLIGEQGLNS
jgi:hypothetical protein